MPRSTPNVASRRKRKRILKTTRGYWGNASRLYRYAKQAADRAGQYSYRDRRKKKSEFRALWIVRLNAACRANGISYSRFIEGLHAAKIELDRKVLSDLAIRDEVAFTGLVKQAQHALAEKAAAAKAAKKA